MKEEIKLAYENVVSYHKYFLDWRHKILAGYILVSSTLCYFIFTWVLNPENYSPPVFIICCFIGILLSFLFKQLNIITNTSLWKYQNFGYLLEKESDFFPEKEHHIKGIFNLTINPKIKQRLDETNNPLVPLVSADKKELWNVKSHAGLMNWIFTTGALLFLVIMIIHLLEHPTKQTSVQENKTIKFIGEWLNISDSSEFCRISKAGNNFTFETNLFPSTQKNEKFPAYYDSKQDKLLIRLGAIDCDAIYSDKGELIIQSGKVLMKSKDKS